MAQDTFQQLWNRVLLYAPGVPVSLVQTFVKNAYNRALAMHAWSELYQDAELVVPADYSAGTIAVNAGVASATLTGGVFTGLTGRQLKVGNSPTYYTVTGEAGAIGTIDRLYQGASGTGLTYNIGAYYVEFPSDLEALDDIRDLSGNWRLRRQYLQPNYLDRVDPSRTSSGSPVTYVAAPPRVLAGVSYPRFEFWPRISGGSRLSYRYIKDVSLTANSDRLISMLPAEAVVAGALADLAMWPGLADRPNPFFSPETHKAYTERFEALVHDGEMADLERSQRLLIYDDDNMGYPGDAKWLQSHGIPF